MYFSSTTKNHSFIPFIVNKYRLWNNSWTKVSKKLHFTRIIEYFLVTEGQWKVKYLGMLTKIYFWRFQIIGWLVYWIFWSLFNFIPSYIFFFFTFVYVIPGFAISLLLRTIYLKYEFSGSLIERFLLIIGFCMAGANIWYVLDLSVDYLLLVAFNKRIYVDISFINYLKLSFYWCLILLSWSMLYFSVKYLIDWNIQKQNTLEAELVLQNSKLDMIKYQINPHFLFNTLNALRALIKENKEEAKKLITALSEFMRYPLVNREVKAIPLSKEIEALENFLIIEKYRFENKLEYDLSIDPVAEEFPVISFLLYPLVENTITAGMQLKKFPIKVSVTAKVLNSKLTIIVNSSNPGNCSESFKKSFFYNGKEDLNKHIETLIKGVGNGKCKYTSLFTPKGASFIVDFENGWNANV